MRLLFALFACLLLCSLVAAQDAESSYEIALERIREAERTGATEISFFGLGLSELPPEIGNLRNLVELDISYNQLITLPPEIGSLVNLRDLNLEHNRLTSLPSEIGNLINLNVLYINDNQLGFLPPEIGKLENLLTLELEENLLTSLAPAIGRLQALSYLNLRNNLLSQLPPEIIDLTHLCVLNLRQNLFQYIPSELAEMQGLNQSGCSVLSFNDGWFNGGAVLGLDGNPLVSPPQEVIAQGTPAIMDYLRNEAWWHLQKLIVSGLGMVAVVTLLVLGLRWRNLRGKQKRKVKEV